MKQETSATLEYLVRQARGFDCDIKPLIRCHAGPENAGESAPGLRDKLQLTVAGTAWKCEVRTITRSDHAHEMEMAFRVADGPTASASVGLAFDFHGWLDSNYVFLPAAVYQGNDFRVEPMAYPPLWRDAADFRADMPVTITDLTRLSRDRRRIELNTGDLSTPCMGYYSPSQGRGVLVFTEQGTRLGNSGMTVELQDDGMTARFAILAPCVREFRQELCGQVPSDDHPASWQAGDELSLRVVVCFFEASELQGLFDRFCELRKALHRADAVHCLPFSAALAMIEEKYNRENWDGEHGFYKMAPDGHTTFEVADAPLCFLWQLGWVGGGQATLPLMFRDAELSRKRAWRNLDMIFGHTQAASGFFHGIGDGVNFYSDGFDRPWPHDMHMVRKSADWLYYSIKHFDLVRKQGREVPEAWHDSVRRLADAFVRLWESHGQIGQIVDVETGKLLVGGSCAGGIAPAGLAMASEWFDEPRYLEVAKASGRKYYEEFIRIGITNGGPGEILSAPDSESAFALVESFAILWETDGDPYWLEAARDALRQAATWVVSYDYVFPEASDLANCGVHTTGAVWANIQNKHGAPAICTLSGEGLLRIWRASKDPLALELLHDIAHGIPQYLSRKDRPLNGRMRPGWMCERVNLSDWEGADGVGGKLFGSCWPEVSMMLTAVEIPGLYVQPDTGFVHVFDHVICGDIIRRDGSLHLKLTNPTAFDAEIKVLCEPSSNCRVPLGLNPLHSSRRIIVPAGTSVEAEFQS